jgi:hypothetical protein
MTQWRQLFLIGMIGLVAADEQYVIWTASSINGFEWKPGRRTYPSMDACEQAIAVRRQRLMREVEALRRIGAEETIVHAIADRMYRCFPTDEAPPKR